MNENKVLPESMGKKYLNINKCNVQAEKVEVCVGQQKGYTCNEKTGTVI